MDHLLLKHEHELIEIHETGVLPNHIDPKYSQTLLIAVGVVVTALFAGLAILGAGIPAVPLVASLETGLLEESVLLGPSFAGWSSNIARMLL